MCPGDNPKGRGPVTSSAHCRHHHLHHGCGIGYIIQAFFAEQGMGRHRGSSGDMLIECSRLASHATQTLITE